MIQLELQPEIEARLLTEAQARGLSLDRYVESIELAQLSIPVEPPLTPDRAKAILALSEEHRLTFYDATYLEVARRLALRSATLDGDLRRAAIPAGVQLIA